MNNYVNRALVAYINCKTKLLPAVVAATSIRRKGTSPLASGSKDARVLPSVAPQEASSAAPSNTGTCPFVSIGKYYATGVLDIRHGRCLPVSKPDRYSAARHYTDTTCYHHGCPSPCPIIVSERLFAGNLTMRFSGPHRHTYIHSAAGYLLP